MSNTVVRTVQTVTRCIGDCAPQGLIAWFDAHSGTAAWLQAVLIPLTIMGTLTAALLPSVLERRRRQQLLLRSATETAAMAAGMFGLLRHVAEDKSMRGVTVQHVSPGYLQSPLAAISAFPVNEMENKTATGQLRLIELRLLSALDLLPGFNSAIRSDSLSDVQRNVVVEMHNELVTAHNVIAKEARVQIA